MTQLDLTAQVEAPAPTSPRLVEWRSRRYRARLIERQGAPYFLVEVETPGGEWVEVRFRPTRLRIIHESGLGVFDEVDRVRILGTEAYEGVRP